MQLQVVSCSYKSFLAVTSRFLQLQRPSVNDFKAGGPLDREGNIPSDALFPRVLGLAKHFKKPTSPVNGPLTDR
jgi:hypothetical protein